MAITQLIIEIHRQFLHQRRGLWGKCYAG